jgi:hypothetical protein
MREGLSGIELTAIGGAFAFSLVVFGVILAGIHEVFGAAWFGFRSRWRRVVALQLTLLALLVGHVLVAVVWTLLLFSWKAFTSANDAFYYVLTSYTTVGYGDVVLTGRWRIVGPIIAVDGVLMFGISTAALVRAMTSTFDAVAAQEREARHPRGEKST